MSITRRTLLYGGTLVAAVSATGIPVISRASGGPDWESLRTRLTGTLVLPAEADYARAKELHFAQFDALEPQGVAYCRSVEDVRLCLRFAQDNGVPARARSGGHSSTGWSSVDGLVIDVSGLNAVTGDASRVTIGSGVQQVDVLAALAPMGVGLAGGLCPTVGAAGFLQGGGFGHLTRKAGMGCDAVVGAEVVLADGRVVRCSAEQEPDLFWALRGGGGGNFGIVTSFDVTPVTISTMVNFSMAWPWEEAAAVLAAWQQWLRDGPDELGSSLTIALPDAAPGATPIVSVTGAWTGAPEAADPALDVLVDLVGSPPTARRVAPLSYQDAMMEWYGCADKSFAQCHRVGYNMEALLQRGTYLRARSRMISDEIPASGVDEILAAFDADRRAGHARAINGAALGGKANQLGRTDTAYVHRDTQFALICADTLPTGTPAEEERQAAEEWTGRGFGVIDRYSNGGTYPNYPDPALVDWQRAYHGENYDRLVQVKRQYDPAGFFRFPHSIG